jgi:hypothetical protein
MYRSMMRHRSHHIPLYVLLMLVCFFYPRTGYRFFSQTVPAPDQDKIDCTACLSNDAAVGSVVIVSSRLRPMHFLLFPIPLFLIIAGLKYRFENGRSDIHVFCSLSAAKDIRLPRQQIP